MTGHVRRGKKVTEPAQAWYGAGRFRQHQPPGQGGTRQVRPNMSNGDWDELVSLLTVLRSIPEHQRDLSAFRHLFETERPDTSLALRLERLITGKASEEDRAIVRQELAGASLRHRFFSVDQEEAAVKEQLTVLSRKL